MSQNPAKKPVGAFYGPENVTCLGQTYVSTGAKFLSTTHFPFSILWTVSNYSELRKLDEILESPIFHGGGSNHKWQLSMSANEEEDNKDEEEDEHVNTLSLYLNIVDYGVGYDPMPEGRKVIKANFKFSILNTNGKPAVETDVLFERFIPIELCCFGGAHDVISMDELINPARQLVVNDSLKILCQVWLEGEMKQKLGNVNGAPSEVERRRVWKDDLVNDIEKMYKESIGTDVTISVGSSILKAHKAILTARSPVFAVMFNIANGMLEAQTATVTIADFEEEVVKGMLEHLYTGNTDSLAERAPELLQIAEKYGLTGLKEHSEYVIANSLNNDNVFETLTFADKYNASFLKSRAADYIKLNKRELLQMESFQAAVKANAKSSGYLIAELFLQQ